MPACLVCPQPDSRWQAYPSSSHFRTSSALHVSTTSRGPSLPRSWWTSGLTGNPIQVLKRVQYRVLPHTQHLSLGVVQDNWLWHPQAQHLAGHCQSARQTRCQLLALPAETELGFVNGSHIESCRTPVLTRRTKGQHPCSPATAIS